MNGSRWFVTTRSRPDETQMHAEIADELETLYGEAGVFPASPLLGVYFAIGYFVGVPEKIKVGRIRKSIGNKLWIELSVDGKKWESCATAELKEWLLLMMSRALIIVGKRYKFATGPFEKKVAELEKKLGDRR